MYPMIERQGADGATTDARNVSGLSCARDWRMSLTTIQELLQVRELEDDSHVFAFRDLQLSGCWFHLTNALAQAHACEGSKCKGRDSPAPCSGAQRERKGV
jgi:hypothetical protein